MAERPLYTLYKNLKAQNFDVPDDYDKFESALTRNGKGGADNRHAIYENLKAQNFDVPDTYERFYSALFHPVSKDSSRANGGSVPMSAADKARMVSNIKAMVSNTMRKNNNVRQNIKNIVSNPKKFYQVGNKIQLGFKNPLHNKNVKEDKFAYNSTTRKTGIYRTTDGESFDNYYAASQYQNQLDQQNNAYQEAVNAGDIPSVFDVRDKNGNYDLQENIGKDGTYLTEEGAQNQLDKKLADAYARKKEIEEAIAEDNHKNGNPLLSYSASLGGGNGRDAASSDYRNKLATSLALVTQQIGALEAVKQYPTSSWGEDAWKALDNTAFTAKTWDFGLTDFATMGQMERIKTKMDNGIPLSGSDKMLLKSKVGADAAAALEDEKMGNVYRWTKIAGQSLPFMADFFLTGGYGGITKGLSRGALKIAAKRGMGKVSAAILKNTGIVMGDVIGSYAMAGTEQAMKTGADIMQRHMGNLYLDENGNYAFGTFDENGNLLHEGGETIGKALYKGLTSAMVENYTEKLFGHNYGIKKGALNFMEKHGMGRAADFFKNIGQSGWYTGSKKWMEKFGINGFAEEVMEEEIGIPLHALLDGEGKVSDLLDPKQQLDIIGGMAISVGSMYAMGIGTKPVKGAYNRAQYYRFKHKVDLADSDAQQLLGDNWEQWKEQMDNATNDKMGGVLYNILQQRDKMSKEQINAAIMYGVNLMKMRGYNLTKTAEMNAREITNEPTTPEEEKEQQIDNAYSEGHEAEAEETHEIQIDQADKQRSLAALLGISEQQLSAMSNEELDALTGQNDNLDRAIYEYQLSNAKYQGVMDNAQDQVDLAAQRAASMTDMITDQTRGTVRNATIKGTQGANDYGVYIINGNLATHDDGAINISGSDQMIIYYDPTTGKVEHADPNRFAALGDENPAEDVKAQAVADAKEKAIKEISGIIDGRVDVGSQFIVTGSDGAQHTYEILADYGDGTAAISIDGNVVENPYSIEDLQNLKDLEDQKRLEAAKAAREQLEAERGEKKAEQQKQEEEKQEQQNQVIADLIDDNGNVVLAAVEGSEDADSFIVGEYNNKKTGVKKYKVVTLNADGTVSKPRLVDASKVSIIGKMSADEYKQTLNVPDSSAVEDKSGENETVPADVAGEEVAHSSETTEEAAPANETTENDNEESAAESPAMTLEDGTIVPMLEDGNPDFSQLTAEQTAELYDEQFGEDADGVISGWVSDAKKALDKANDMSIKGKNFVEQKASKEAKEKAIADAQAAYDSAVAIRDAYNERQLAKEENTPEGRRNLIEKARRKFNRLKGAVKDDAEATLQLYQDTVGSVLHRLYDGTGIDVTDDVPLTAEEYVASSITPYSLNYEGNENSKGVKQETGLSREDFAKTRLLAKDGKGTTIDKMVDKLWNDRPSNLDSLDTQDIRAALLDLIMSGKTATDFKTYVQDMRINEAEKILEEQKRAEDNAKFAEEQKNADENEKVNEKVNESDAEDNVAESESYEESLKKALEKVAPFAKALKQAVESGDKKAIEKAQQELTDAMVSNNLGLGYLYSQLAQYGLTKRKDDSYKLSRAIMKSLKDAIQTVENSLDSAIQNAGLDGVHIDFNEAGDGWIYADKGSEWYNRLEALDNNYRWLSQDNITIDNVSKIANIIKSQIEEGERYNADADTEDETAPAEDKQFPSKLREGKQEGTTEIPEDATDEKPLGEQKAADEVPFSAKDNGNQETTEERAANVEKNKVEGTDVVDAIIGKKTRKALDRIAKMMGAKIQYQYTDKLGNGWYNADTNTIYLTLDSSITEGVQFIFGHEMTHEIKTKNAEAFEELAKLVKGSITDFDKAVDDMWKRYSKAGLSGYDRAYYEEEVIADGIGYMMRDLNYAHTLAMKMSHPLLAKIHEIINRIRMAFHGTEYTETAKNIMRSIEQAYVKTANGTFEDSTTGEDARYSLRQKPEPTKKGIGYKVFVLKNGKLYPPMVANPNGAETPVGVWLDADAAPIAGESKTGRPQVKQGGKGTQGGSGKLAYRPGWHLGVIPYALQFNRKDAEGNKTLFPANFVFAEVEYAADVDYQEEARQEGINANGKYQHSLAGLKHLPTDGYYMYRTNPNPETDPWVITGAMKVNRILTRAEQADLVRKAGREPQQIQEGDIVTDEVVNSINQQIANAPKFSLKVYHGSGADFSEFDFDHMGEGEGSQVFGWGGYVTSSKKIGKDYATRMDNDPSRANYRIQQSNGIRFKKKYPTLESFLKDEQIAKKDIFTEQEKIDYYNEKIKMAEPYHNLYEVNIPDDNGENYLDWGEKLSDDAATKIYEGLYGLNAKTLDDMAARDAVFRSLLYDSLKYPDKNTMIPLLVKTNSLTRTTMFDSRPIEDTFKSVYIRLEDWMGSPKAASQFLSSIGFTGIKYPAGTIQGGAEEGDTNYVIFKPEDMKIAEHTKFSIRTYHGSQASFDHFDHSFMGSGEGAQAYGWGTYVSEVEGIAKAYAKQNARRHQMRNDKSVLQVRYHSEEARLNMFKNSRDAVNESISLRQKNIKRKLEMISDEENDLPRLISIYGEKSDIVNDSKEFISKLKTIVENGKEGLAEYEKRKKELEQQIAEKEKVLKDLEAQMKATHTMPERNLYTVEIPDDTGDNYIGWDEPMTDEQGRKIFHALYALPKEQLDKMAKRDRLFRDLLYTILNNVDENKAVPTLVESKTLTQDTAYDSVPDTGGSAYKRLTDWFGSQKEASLFLKDAGFDGVKVIAQRNTGGNKEGKMNYVIFDENDAKITNHTKFSLKSKPVRFEVGKSLSEDEKKEVLSTLKDAYKVNGVPYHTEETANGKEKRVYEPTADDYVMSDITNRPLRYYITLPDGRVAHPTEVYPNISDHEVKSSVAKQGFADSEAVEMANKVISKIYDAKVDAKKALAILNAMQELPHDTRDVGYGMNNAQSYNYKTGIFTSDAAQAIDYVVRRMRRKEEVSDDVVKAVKKAVADNFGMVDNLIDGMSETKVGSADTTDSKFSLRMPKPLLTVDGKPAVVKEDDGSVELNYATWQKEKEQVRDALTIDAGLDEDEADAILANADTIAEGMKDLMKKYPRFRDFQYQEAGNRDIIRDNGDYLSWDYSFNCIKKDAMNAVMDKLVSMGKSGHLGVTQVEAIKRILQKHKFLTPCVMCYVEGKRKVLKQSKMDEQKWNAVREAAGLDNKLMGEPTELTKEQEKVLTELSNGEGLERVKGYTSEKKEDGITADTVKKISSLMLKSNILRGNMNYEWMMSPSAFTKMYDMFGNTKLMDYLTVGQYRGKQLLEAVPFSINGIPRDIYLKMYSQVELKERGGLRQFSYEDARAMMFFDYYTQFLLMQGARAPEHLYTKRPFMPEMFGKTGAMINQSLIVDVWKGDEWHRNALGLNDAEYDQWLRDNAGFIPRGALSKDNADYEEGSTELVPAWSVESFPLDEAMKNVHNKDFKGNVGNTVVAPSHRFIQWALDNPDIHMILAYHATGGSPIMKSLSGYSLATAMDKGYHTLGKDGKAIKDLEVKEIGLEISGGALQWNRLLRRNGYDAKKAAQVYLDYCKENGLTPMFNYEGVVDHPNYYKMLTDFRVYDEDGKSIRQKAVKAVLPENWKEILNKYLEQEQTSSNKVSGITLDADVMKEIEAATKFGSIEADERNGVVSLLQKIYGKNNVEVLSQKDFDNSLDSDTEEGRAQMIRDNGGMVYGYAKGEKIVLNEYVFNANTPLHEHTHIYMKVLSTFNPKLYERGMELWKDTPQWNEAKADIEQLGEEPTDERVFSECMAQFTGSENEKIIAEVTGVTDKNWMRKAVEWLKEMWEGVKSAFKRWTKNDLDALTAEQFAHMPLRSFYDETERKEYVNKVKDLEKAGGFDNGVRYSLKDDERKQAQLDIVLRTNPMLDDYHTGIRKVEDIKTFAEAVKEGQEEAEKGGWDEWSTYPDETNDLLQDALGSGYITIYSSKPIVNGNFVTPSRMQAEDYAGGEEVYEKTVPVTDVAWINVDEGQYARVEDGVLFSLKSLENKPEGWKQANKKAIHIAETIERDPKFSLKKLDGTLIKSGTYFSGGGLVEEGLKGIIDPVVAVEYDEKISGVYRNNFGQHIVTADVRDVDPKELVKSIDGEVEFFHASPVCKNFSQAKMNHEEVELDKETAQSTADFINQVKPKVVTIENVKGYRDSEAMKTITDALDKNGYKWDADVYNAADYGGYTNRERLIVRAVREGELPEKPRKMARKNGWYEAVEDIMPTLTEKKNGVAPWMDVRLKADGIDWRNIDKPLYVMGSAYANGKIPHAFGDELLPTLRTKSGDVIVMPDGKVYRASGRVLARVSGVSDDYKMPYSEALSHTIIGNGIPTQLTEHVIAPLLQVTLKPTSPEEGGNTKFSLKQQKEKIVEDAKKNGNYMLAPNGKKTRLDAEQWVNVRTNNFKKWFGDWEIDPENASKVVDENGEPMVVYHGRSTDFNTFEKKEGVRFVMGLEDKVKAEGFFFSPDKGLAEEFAGNAARHRGGKANVVPCFLNIRKPLDLVSEGYDNKYEDVTGWSWVVGMDSQDNLWEIMDEEGMADKMKAKGYDGAIFVEEVDDNYEPTKISYCALDANQIKSADNNNGEYSSDNNDIRFSLRVDQYQHDLAQWKKDNGLSKDAERPSIPVREQNENAADFLKRVKEYRRQMALWKTAPQYEQHLLSDDTAQGQFNLELQRSTVLARIALQDSMLAIRKAQEAIMKEVGVDRLNIAEDAYTAENRSHGKGKNEFEEYNDEFLQPLRRAYNQMMKNLGKSYDNVKVYMIAKHGLERNAHIAFKYALENDYEDAAQRTAAYKAYKSDMNRLTNDADFESGKINFNTWRIQDNGIRSKYAPSYLDYRYDKLGITQDYSGLSALFDGSDFEEAAADLVKDVEDKYGMDAQALWDATNAATKKILRDSHKAGMMSDEVYDFVRGMYSHYIPLRGWGDTNADQVWNYMGGGKGAFNQTLKEAKGRGSLADDPIAYIENMAESGILINNKNWVKQHLLLLAQNHPTSLLNVSKAWYVKSVDANGNEEWIPASPNITANMTSRQVEAELEAFQKKMEAMEQNGDATQKREHLEISYPQTNSEEREHEVRVMKGGEEYVIYVNGDPQLAQAMNNTRAQRVRQGLENSISQRALAWLGRKMAAAYTSLSPLFIPSNFFRDTTMTLASTAIREDARYNYLLRKNMLTHWNTLPLVVSYQNGTLREKVRTGKASKTEQMFYDFMMNGGETGFVSSLDVEDLKKKFKNDLKDMNRMAVNPKKVGHIIMDSIETLNRAIEDSNRFMVYMTSIQYGRSIDEAVNDAKDVTLNFNRKGTGEHGWQTFRNLYLFINPAIQSLQTLGALAKHHPFKFTAVTTAWLTSGLLMPMVNNMLMSMFGGDDDKDKYWSFTKWDRRNNFIMWVPGTHDFVKIPLAQEFRGFYAVGDMIASKLWGGEKAEESWEDYGWDLMGQVVDMLPLDPTGYDGNIAVSLMPNPIRPMFELAFNVDFTGKPLFKDSEYNKYDPNFTKAYVGTPDWLVRISRMVNSIGNDYPDIQQNAIDKIGDPRYNLNNPAVVDHVLSSYLGGAYTMGSQILGVATKMLNGDEVKMADVPVASKFVGNPDDRPASKKQGDEFWTMKERHDRAANTLSKLKKLAKVDGDYSTLDVFFDSDEYKQYKLDDAKVKKYEEEKKKERAEESGDEYKAHKTTAEDIYKAHATPKDDFEDLKMSQIYPKVNGIKKSWEGLLDMVSSQADSFYNENADAIQAADEVADIREQINDIKKEFLSEDGKDAWNAEDMKEIRQLRKEALSILEKVNKVIVAKQKAKTEKEK